MSDNCSPVNNKFRFDILTCRRTSSAESLDIEIEILRRLLRDAADPSKFRPGVKPSLTIKQKNHWCALLDEIGRLVGGYLKSLKNPPRE